MANRVMVVFVDALGPEQLARIGGVLPSLPHRKALRGVMGFSSGALATVLTGAPPAAHGRMCLFTQRAPDASGLLEPLRWVGLLPRIVHERTRVRGILARMLQKSAGLSGYVALHRVPPEAFRWLDMPERDDLFRAEDVGGVPTFLADARAAGLGVYAAPWQLPEEARWAHVHRALATHHPDLAFLYAARLDAALHEEGNHGGRAGEVLSEIGDHIERARDEMMRGGGTLTTLVVGDHGMADVDTFVDPRPVLRPLVRRLGADAPRYFIDSTMVRFWGEQAELDQARAVLEQARLPGQWLASDVLAEREVPMEGAPYGQGFFLLDEGAIFAPSWVGGRVAGMHGYDVGMGSARAALASDTPIPDACDSIAGVAPMVRRRLGLDA